MTIIYIIICIILNIVLYNEYNVDCQMSQSTLYMSSHLFNNYVHVFIFLHNEVLYTTVYPPSPSEEYFFVKCSWGPKTQRKHEIEGRKWRSKNNRVPPKDLTQHWLINITVIR